ncbi:MAG: hypothetical protein GXO88_00205 [Chlorobi bacterium]|nr:hypothetical protein [Chlorobiota bacterium]
MQLSRNILVLIAICMLSMNHNVHAQTFGSNILDISKPDSNNKVAGFAKTKAAPKLNVKLSLGTSFSGFGNGYSAFGTYVAPELSMPVSKKVDLSFGMAYSTMSFAGPTASGFSNNSANYGSIYVSGTYHLNEKLSIRATGYKTFLLNPSNFNAENQDNYLDFSSQGAILDLQYNVSEHFSISASFRYSEQKNPNYFSNPYGGQGAYNGFNPAPNLNSGFGGFGQGF